MNSHKGLIFCCGPNQRSNQFGMLPGIAWLSKLLVNFTHCNSHPRDSLINCVLARLVDIHSHSFNTGRSIVAAKGGAV